MPVFAYKAVDLDASAVAGTVVAGTPRQARDDLRSRGLTVAEITPARGGDRASLWRWHRARAAQG